MAGARQLLRVALLSLTAHHALAASKKLVAHIQCAVCKQAVKEASLHAKEKHIDSNEEALMDSVENLCSATKDEGKWTTRMDIIRKPGGSQLGLDRRDEPGVCNNECKAVSKACAMTLKNREESLVSLIAEGAGVGRLQREVCGKPCEKSLPELVGWKDEEFQPAKPPSPAPPPKKDPKDRILEALFSELDLTVHDVRACYSGPRAAESSSLFAKEIGLSIEDMLQKDMTKMRSGLGRLGRAVAALARTLASLCRHSAVALQKMEALGAKLGECEVDESVIEYKPMEVLQIHGHDIHRLLNDFIGVLKNKDGDGSSGVELGKTLGKILKQFENDIEISTLKTEL